MGAKNNMVEIQAPQATALFALHTRLKGKMVDFAGYSMPVQFPEGIKSEHLHTRAHAGLFDVSHMGQIRIIGDNAAAALETLVTGDITGLEDFQQRYTLLTNNEGGIVDDVMVTKIPGGLFVVVNAANKHSDYSYLKACLDLTCRVEMMVDHALLALQGPQAAGVLNTLDPAIGRLGFMTAREFEIKGKVCLINRCGYTGEDGFEISVSNAHAEKLAELLLEFSEVLPVGLGARDSLRLEAGLCLHGHDIGKTTSPIEANLHWAVAKKYRDGSAVADFPGARIILKQWDNGTDKRLVGLLAEGKMPIREGVAILNLEGLEIGRVSSGGFGPTLNGPVAMGYLANEYIQTGTELQVEIRNRFHTICVADLPFVKHQYYKH
ncbi:MAG: aminomethyltransferase [Planctomycetota bacterium]|jgi:aminomethyltransferase